MPALTPQQSLDLALDYVALNPGRCIFPIKAGAKFPPLLKDNLAQASSDPVQLSKWSKQWPGCNWGLSLRKSRIMAVDVDTKPGKIGQATYDALDLDYGFPDTEEARSPTGGRHKIYEGEHVFALGAHGFGPDIDSPNYIIIAGSATKDGYYETVTPHAAAPAPQWFYDVIGRAKQRMVGTEETAIELDKPASIAWAIDYLKADAEPAIEGKNGDFQTLKVAMSLRDQGVSEATAYALMNEHYNPRCIPPWDENDLEKKVQNGYSYASQSQAGGKAAEAEFEDTDDVDLDVIPTLGDPKIIAAEKEARARTREREAAIPIDQRQEVLTKQQVIDRFVWVSDIDRFIMIDNPRVMWKRASFDAMYRYCVKKGSFSDTLFAAKSGTIRRFETIGFVPGEGISLENGRICNLYRPSNVKPREGDTSWWQAHLEYLFPESDDRHLLMCWLSWFYQNLKKKPKHALLLQGRLQGTGKSFIVDMLAAIIGEHNRAVVSQTDLGTDFNGYGGRTKLIAIEELRAVDRANVKNALHDIITQDFISINEKNMPKIEIKNCFGIIAMTNDDAAISLDQSDRRYLVLRTSADPKSETYYTELYDRIGKPECVAAIAYHLQTYDYGEYNGASRAPRTSAKTEMINAGMNELDSFMKENMHSYPLSGRVIAVTDVIDMLPKRLERHPRLTQAVCSALKVHFQAQLAGQFRLSTGKRVRLYVINGSGLMNLEGWNDRIAGLYEADRKAGSLSATLDDDDDAANELLTDD